MTLNIPPSAPDKDWKSPLRELSWSPPGTGTQLEILAREALFDRVPHALLTQPERLDFHLIIVCHGGVGRHAVDGEIVPMGRGVVLHIQPGQIHQWAADATYDAWLILAPHLPLVPVSRAVGSRVREASDEALHAANHLAEITQHSSMRRAEDRLPAQRAIIDLLTIALGLTAPDPLPAGPYGTLYLAFREDVAGLPDVRESLSRRAARLGCSSRTLT
ncbi:MAG: AraC family ligand binding domain-containing protein, partial [Pseudomonadota bacterium]